MNRSRLIRGRLWLLGIGIVLLIPLVGGIWYAWSTYLAPLPSPVPTSQLDIEQVENITPTPFKSSSSATPILSSQTNTSGLETEITLGEAIASLSVVAEFRGPSTVSGDHVVLTIRRTITDELNIIVPSGSFLVNTNQVEANLIVHQLHGTIDSNGEDHTIEIIRLSDNEWHEYILEAYSLNFHKDQPRPNATFVWSDPLSADELDPALLEMLAILEKAKGIPEVSSDVIQVALWAVASGIDQKTLMDVDYDVDIETVRAIFKEAELNPEDKRLFSQSQPQTAEEYFDRGRTYAQMEEYVQALADYTDAIELNPDYTEALYERAVIFKQQQNYAQAIADLTKVVQLDEEHRDAHYNLGELYSTNPDPAYELSIRHLNEAINLGEDSADAYYTRGLAYAALQDLSQSIIDFSEAIERDSQFVDAYFARGVAHAAILETNDAITDFTAAIEQDKNFVEAYYARGEVYSINGKFTEAMADFDEVIYQEPDFVDAYRERGLIHYRNSDYENAIEELRTYLEKDPQAVDNREISTLITQAFLLTPTTNTTSIFDAVNDDLVQIRFFGLGIVSGDSIILDVQNTSDQELRITIPQGTILKTEPNVQDMVVRRLRALIDDNAEPQATTVIHLTDDEPHRYLIEAYGLDISKTAATTTTDFFVGELADQELLQILEVSDEMFGTEGSVIDIQSAIWAITNDVTWLDLDEKQYHPDLLIVQNIFQSAGLDFRCRNLFDGTPPCTPLAKPALVTTVPEQSETTTEAEEDTANPNLSSPPTGIHQLIYTKWDGGQHNLYIADTDGGNEQLLLTKAAGPSWDPNGRIFFFGEPGVKQQTVPDGRTFIKEEIGDGIVIFENASLRPLIEDALLSQPQGWNQGLARWANVSPDGHFVAYDANIGGSFRIYFLGVLDGQQSPVQIVGEQADWSPDNQFIVYRSGRDGINGIWISNQNDSESRNITTNGTDSFPSWSPDGSQIAFSREINGDTDIYVINVNGSGLQRLTDTSGHDTLPVFTPSGDVIFRSTRSGNWGIWKMTSNGENQTEIIEDAPIGDDWAFSRMDVR